MSAEHDLFICHAGEDKVRVARPLAQALIDRGMKVWLDELELTIGDSLNGLIEAALARTRFGVVILSPSFFEKDWPQRELAGLAAREIDAGAKVILPVWHDVDRHYIAQRSPILADRLGAPTSGGITKVADELIQALGRAGSPMPETPSGGSAGVSGDRSTAARATFIPRGRNLMFTLVVALAATFGFVAAPSVRSAGRLEALSKRVATQSFEVKLPASWRRAATLPPTPGLALAGALSLRASGTGHAALVIGTEQTSSPTLLPASLLSSLPKTPKGEVVQLGKSSFYRYRDLRPDGTSGFESLYVEPATKGVVAGVCLPARGFGTRASAECERVLGTLGLVAAQPLALGPQASYALALRRAMSALNAVRSGAGAELAQAKTSALQAGAAERLAKAHARAAAILRHAVPGPAERVAAAAILAAIARVAAGYSTIAGAARAGSPQAYDRGSRAVSSADKALLGALASLSSFGYRLER